MNKIVYIADLDQDIDDIIAIEYLYSQDVLDYIVLDPNPIENQGKKRMNILKSMGIKIKYNIQPNTKIVFSGGGLTKVAKCIRNNNKLDLLVMNGGFVGNDVIPLEKQLSKFKNKNVVRTYNFNQDVISTDYILKTNRDQIKQIILIGKNVCHNKINTPMNLWRSKEYSKLFDKYNVRENKLQHDLLACHEGLAYLDNNIRHICKFKLVYPYNEGLNDNMTMWGSKLDTTEYRQVLAAVDYI